MLKKLHTDIFAHKNAVNAYIIPSQPLWTAIKGEQYSDYLRLPACSRQGL